MNLAARDVRHNLGRFALTTLGVGMLLMVVMGMGGIYRGVVEDATLLVDRVGADLWVVQRDTRGPFAEVSRVPPNLVHRVTAVPGVRSAREFVYHTVQREHRGRPLRVAVLGLGWPADRGEWLPLASGRPLAQGHFELVADETLGLGVGERVRLGRDDYTVVGVTRGMISANGDGIGFVAAADALAIQFDAAGEAIRLERAARQGRGERTDLTRTQPSLLAQAEKSAAELAAIPRLQPSAVLVRVEPGADPDAVAAVIAGWGDVSVYTADGQRDLLLKGSVEKVRRQIGLFTALLTAIAAIIMALIVYTLTLDKLHSIALLKLIGAPNRVILGMIVQQALAMGALGYAVAYALGRQLFPLFPRRVILAEEDLLRLAVIVLGISVAASVLGIWKAVRVSPAEALA
jgi:putative ABC transport system permease protein